MATELLPAIGASGSWTLKPPYDTQLISGLAYTCKAIRKLSEVVATGIDAKAEYYDANGIDPSVYDANVAADISIVTLTSSSGNWLFVPTPYLSGWPTGDAVPYVVLGMIVNLGALPNTLDPTFLIEKVSNVITSNLGNVPDIEFVALSEVTNKTWDVHEGLEAARQNNITDDNTDYIRRVNAEAALATAQATIQALQQFIIDAGLVPPSPAPTPPTGP